MTSSNAAADAIVDALTEKLNATLGAGVVDLLADAIASRLQSSVAADIAARLRIDVLAGDDLLLSRAEAARFIGRSPKTLELWASKDIGPKVSQLGPRCVAYRIADLREFARSTGIGPEQVAGFVSEGNKSAA